MTTLILCIMGGLLLFFSPSVMEIATSTLQIFGCSVMPALFPMMMISQLLGCMKQSTASPRRSFWLTACFGFLAGSPASAKRVHQCGGQVSVLLCITGVMSPMFFLGTLSQWTHQRALMGLLLLIHWASALITGLVCWLLERNGETCALTSVIPSQDPIPLLVRFPAIITHTAQAMLSILGAMLVFSTLSALLGQSLSFFFPSWTSMHPQALAILWCLMEIGGGSYALLQASATPPLALLCALCSFGGLSIWMQNLLFVSEDVSAFRLLSYRAFHALIAYVLCKGCLPLISFASPTFIEASTSVAGLSFSTLSLLGLSLLLIASALPTKRENLRL